MVYMFNELSVVDVRTIDEVRTILSTFVKATIAIKKFGFDNLRLHQLSLSTLYELNFSDNYKLNDWLNDDTIQQELRDSFKSILTSFPLITNEEIDQKDVYERSEFYKCFENVKTKVFGLGASYVYGTLTISLDSHPEWKKHLIEFENYSLDHEGIEKTEIVSTLNFSCESSLELHRDWIDNQNKQSIVKSNDVWENRDTLFPNIKLGPDIEFQLKKIGLSQNLDHAFECLVKLDSYAKNWTEGGFSINNFKATTLLKMSGESDTTMKKFGAQRKFRNVNGQKIQFEYHIKKPGLRIYFFPDEENHSFIVGYIGKHLRIASEN